MDTRTARVFSSAELLDWSFGSSDASGTAEMDMSQSTPIGATARSCFSGMYLSSLPAI